MAYDGVVTGAVARELKETLVRGKIEKIYQPEKEELVLYVRTREGRKKLYLSCATSHCGAYISEEEFTNPPTPSAFCMLLRKHLQGSVLLDIYQKDCERILEFSCETFDELGVRGTKRLIIEIMGKHSNIIFVDDEKETVLDAIKRVSIDVSRERQLLPGFPFDYPPTGGKVPFSQVTADDLLAFDFTAERDPADVVLAHVQGISPLLARAVTQGIDPKNREGAARLIAARLAKITEALSGGALDPAVYLKDPAGPADFHVLSIAEYANIYEKRSFATVSEAIAWYYAHRESSNRIRQKSADVTRAVNAALKKARLKKKRLGEDLLEAEKGETYRLYGELLTANLHAVHTGDKEVTVTNYYDGSTVRIPLDVRYAPAKNAQRYFKKYSKSKVALREKALQLAETDKDIAYLESVADLAERATDVTQLNALKEELIETGFLRRRTAKAGGGQKERLQPFRYKSSSGLDILAGRNNKENDYLTCKVAGKNDLWFHTKDIPGSHVILFVKNKEPDDRSIYEAARIAAFHSKASRSENVPVDYTRVRYVKKPNGAKPGMVIFTDNHTVYVGPKLPETK